MSPSAVTERVRRLEEAGVITGYSAVIDHERVGCRSSRWSGLRYPTGNYRPFHDMLATTPEVLEAHHVTVNDCFVMKVAARSMRHLEETTGGIAGLGRSPRASSTPRRWSAARSVPDGRGARGAHPYRRAVPAFDHPQLGRDTVPQIRYVADDAHRASRSRSPSSTSTPRPGSGRPGCRSPHR